MKKEAFEAARSSVMSGGRHAGAKGEAPPKKTDPARRGHLRGQGGLEGSEGDAPPDEAHQETAEVATDAPERRPRLRGQDEAAAPGENAPTGGSSKKHRDS